MALDAQEGQALLDTLNSERSVGTAPAAVHATLLDEGRYLGSVRTMYQLLAANGGCRERRNQLTHPACAHAGAARHRPQPDLVLGFPRYSMNYPSGPASTCTSS